MATALHEVQANLTAVSSCTGGGESRGTLLALLGPAARDAGTMLSALSILLPCRPCVPPYCSQRRDLLPREAEHWPRVTQLARGKGASLDARNWGCLPTMPTAFQMQTQQERGRGGLRLATQRI